MASSHKKHRSEPMHCNRVVLTLGGGAVVGQSGCPLAGNGLAIFFFRPDKDGLSEIQILETCADDDLPKSRPPPPHLLALPTDNGFTQKNGLQMMGGSNSDFSAQDPPQDPKNERIFYGSFFLFGRGSTEPITTHTIHQEPQHGVNLLRLLLTLPPQKQPIPPHPHPPKHKQIFVVGLSCGIVVFRPPRSRRWLAVVCCRQPSIAPVPMSSRTRRSMPDHCRHLPPRDHRRRRRLPPPRLRPSHRWLVVVCCFVIPTPPAHTVLRLPSVVVRLSCERRRRRGRPRTKPDAAASHFRRDGASAPSTPPGALPCVGGGLSASGISVRVPRWQIGEGGGLKAVGCGLCAHHVSFPPLNKMLSLLEEELSSQKWAELVVD